MHAGARPILAAADDETTWERERPRLVRLCATITGDPSAAEDLAQETLLEAWRHRDSVREPDRHAQWLTGIARNVCFRWVRHRGRDLAHLAPLPGDDGLAAPDDAEAPSEAFGADATAGASVEIALEREELAALLDRALALLPPETRAALVAHELDEIPLAEIAARQGLRASAVAMRLRRGKLTLRRVLTTELAGELDAWGYGPTADRGWEDTPLWCPVCGVRHLQGRYHRAAGDLWLRCPACAAAPDDYLVETHAIEILGGVPGYRRAYDRLVTWMARYYPPNLRAGAVPCLRCGRPMLLRREPPARMTPSGWSTGLFHTCPDCDIECWQSLEGLVLAAPDARRFERRHGRLRTLPPYAVEAEGRPALVTRVESVTSRDTLAVVTDAATFETLRIHGARS